MDQTRQNVATTLEQELTPTIERWMQRVSEVPALMAITLSHQERMGHLPQLLKELIVRLHLPDGTARPSTKSAPDHGRARFRQGYEVPMLVEESRLLQVSIFDTLRRKQRDLDPGEMMQGVIVVADECDAQLRETVETFMELERDAEQRRQRIRA